MKQKDNIMNSFDYFARANNTDVRYDLPNKQLLKQADELIAQELAKEALAKAKTTSKSKGKSK